MTVSDKLFRSELDRTRDLVQSPEWYMQYGRLQQMRALGLGALQATSSGSIYEARHELVQQQIKVFEQLLIEGAVRIGDPEIDDLENWDKERSSVDRIMIHHTHRSDGLSLSELNAMHLLRLYLPRYRRGDLMTDDGKHQPIHSAHFDDNGKQVFYGYHWKVEQDGSSKQLLPDAALLWHAGKWEMNQRSVSIVIDDDLTDKDPTPESLETVATILSDHYRYVNLTPETLLGHHDSFDTVCPGNTFESSWKQKLLATE